MYNSDNQSLQQTAALPVTVPKFPLISDMPVYANSGIPGCRGYRR